MTVCQVMIEKETQSIGKERRGSKSFVYAWIKIFKLKQTPHSVK